MDEPITYKVTHQLGAKELERLFLSVNWSSGHYPDKLAEAMENYETVFTAWHGDRLVGLVSAMDDGVMTAYVHYLLVDPQYQGQGIGRRLVDYIKTVYVDYLRIVLVAYVDGTAFYEACGFKASHNACPMYITSLWT